MKCCVRHCVISRPPAAFINLTLMYADIVSAVPFDAILCLPWNSEILSPLDPL